MEAYSLKVGHGSVYYYNPTASEIAKRL
jgi:hypothetical protein